MFWILWFSLVVILLSSVVGVFSWNGSLLEIVKIKLAKKLWVLSVIGITLGLLLFAWSVLEIMNTPSLVAKFSRVPTTPSIWMWIAILLLVLGGFVVGLPTQIYQLKLTKLTRGMRQNLFYLGMFLLVISMLVLIWLLIPGNQLPA